MEPAGGLHLTLLEYQSLVTIAPSAMDNITSDSKGQKYCHTLSGANFNAMLRLPCRKIALL
jgi:hypothetical protein